MTKKIAALAVLVTVLLTPHPHAQANARIFFVDVGTGAGTLIVSPTGKTLLVDGGPPTAGTQRILPLLNSLGITKIDFTIVTHYHIDHMGGMIEVLNAGKVAGGIAYDNGDGADVQPPGTSISSSSTRGTYLNYVTATNTGGAIRQTAVPGTVIDLGGGMRATIVAAGGRFLSGGSVPITTDDLNSESISTLIEYNDFDYLVSGDLTGGGSTSTAKTPDVETYVAQMIGDVDVVQLDHHGSTTANNQAFLSALKAEVAFAQTGDNNGFGHPNRETANKFLNTPDTAGVSFTGTGVPPTAPSPALSSGPVFYQIEAPQAGDDRVTLQGYTGATAGNAGHGTVLLSTDGTTTYSMSTIDPAGAGFNHTYAVDGASNGLATNFKPTVVVNPSPVLPLATDSTVLTALVNDREDAIASVTLTYALNGTAQSPVSMTLLGGSQYQATIPAQPDGTRVDYSVIAVAGGQTTTYTAGYFSGTTSIATLHTLNALGEPVYTGYPARISGTVTASGFSANTNDDYVQDATGALNVYKSTDGPTPYTPTLPGQVVEVRGRINFNGGRFKLDLTESVEKTTSPFGVTVIASNPEPTPTTTNFAVLSANPESFEGQLVSVPNVHLVSGTFPLTPQSLDAFVTVNDGFADFSLKIDHDTDVEGFTPATTFTAVGIIQQDDYLRPFTSGYNLTPRSAADLGATAPPPPPVLTIADARVDAVTNADGNPPADTVPDLLGRVVTVRGAVTSIDFRGGNGIEYYIQDATGGVDLFSTTTNFGPFAIGDNVEATGTVTQFNGLTELTVTSVVPLPGTTTIAPQVVTLAQLADGAGDALEGRLIRVNNVTVISGTFPAANTDANLTIGDGTGTTVMRIDRDTDIDGTPTVSGTFSLIALASQFDSAAPFDGGYQILPRSLADIIASGPTCPAITIGGTLPNGVIGTPYSQTLTASGGTAPYTFSIATGTLPAGLSISDAGVVSGTPTVAGTSTVTVIATATGGCTGAATFTISTFGVLTASPATLALGTVAVGGAGSGSVTITNTSAGVVTLNPPFTITGADATQFIVGAPNTTTLAAGGSATASVTFLPTTGGAKTATLNITSTGDGVATVALTGTGSTSSSGGSGVVLSEFRTRGPLGGNDEFFEIYNNSDDPIDISGWQLMGSSQTGSAISTRATVAANTVLPARAHYLFVNTTATTGYSGAVPGNRGFTTGISDNGGAAIARADGTIVDQFGVATTAAGFREGTAPTIQLTTNTDRSYERKPGALSVTLQDTNDNSADFQLVTPSTPQNIVLTSSPASLNFGSVVPPGTQAQTITIKNLLISAVTLTSPFTVVGADAADFSVSAPGTTTLASGATTTVTVTFQPISFGHKAATLSVTSSSGGALAVPLSGDAIGGVAVTPSPVDFGSVAPGGSASTTLTIANSDAVNSITLTPPFAITGPDANQFTVGAPGTAFLAGGDSTPLSVSFQPTTTGAKSATLRVTSVNGGSQLVPLSGLAACPAITVSGSPSSGFVNTPYAAVFSASGATGPFTFTIAGGTAPSGLMLGTNGTLAGSPDAAGSFTFTVQAAAANGCTGTALFTVTITVPIIPLTAAPASIDFGAVMSPATSTQTVTLTNNTSEPITLNTPFTVSGTDAAQFSVGAPATTTLGALSSTTATVTFAPSAPGAKTATLTVTSSGGGSATVALSGRGASPILISEFRTRGPLGANDEFVEIYNNSDSAVDISGWKLVGSSNTAPSGTRATVPANVTLPGRTHYLFVNTTATTGYSGSVPGNKGYTTGVSDNGGVALELPDNTIVDQVGVTTTTGFREGTALQVQLASNVDRSYERKPGAASPTLQDTDDNSADFQLTTPSTPQSLVFAVAPASLDFGSVAQLTTSTRTVTITNLVLTPVTLTAPFAVTGADASSFAAGVPGTTTLAPGSSTIVAVSFQPVTTGDTAATLTITSTAGSLSIALTGTATPDTSAPVLTLPGDITVEASSALTVVAYSASALDPVDGPIAPVCSPASGSGFSVGTTTVSCTATDPHGNSASGSFSVTVTDTTAPTVTVPAGITSEATGPTTVVSFAATASDSVDGAVATVCAPASGSGFAVGTTAVSCSATDAHGNTGHASFAVTITDHTAPAITVPGNITATATTPSGAVVSFAASASDLVDGTRPTACVPASGSTFAIGVTTVSCTAADVHGNSASASFTVTVAAANVPGRMNGNAEIAIGAVTHAIDFTVQEGPAGADSGSLRYRVVTKQKGHNLESEFRSTAITTVSFFNVPGVSPGVRPPSGVDTAAFAGAGTWNGRPGYTFSATATDNNAPGRDPDLFSITVKDAANQVVATVSGTVTRGRIESQRARP